MKMFKICLNMIVKNESKVIARCLESVKDIIDTWVIVDTGSTDSTKEVIAKCLKGIPGELYERPWVDFAQSRNVAMQLCKGKAFYLLFIDADEYLALKSPLPTLKNDYYSAPYYHGQSVSQRILLINNTLNWEWKYPVHEMLDSQGKQGEVLPNAKIVAESDGFRSQGDKFSEDAKILKRALEKEPDNSRFVFHLAECYESANENELALEYYMKRAAMPGDHLETFVALYRIGVVQEKLKMPPEQFIGSYLKAYHWRPTRPEPLFCLANYFMGIQSYILGYLIADFALTNPIENDYYYTQIRIYDYGLLYQLAECAFRLRKYGEAYQALKKLLKVESVPGDLRQACQKNFDLPVFDEFR